MKPRKTPFRAWHVLVGAYLVVFGVTPWAMFVGCVVWLPYLLVAAVMVIPVVWLGLVVHELGHLLAALFLGLRVEQVAVKPLQLVRRNGVLRLRFFLSDQDGVVRVSPTGGRRFGQQMIVVVAGGPIANLGLALACLVAAWCVDPFSVPLVPRTHGGYWLDFVALMNLAVGLANLVPGRSRSLPSDGSQLAAWRRKDRAESNVLVSRHY